LVNGGPFTGQTHDLGIDLRIQGFLHTNQNSDKIDKMDTQTWWTGPVVSYADKRGAIASNLPPILQRLRIDPKHGLFLTQHFETRFKGLVGTAYQLNRVCETLGYQRAPGLKHCQTYFP
jgi:hypothetical protein